MKRIFILTLILVVFNPICGFSQTDHQHKPLNEQEALAKFNYTKFISDFSQVASQKGYDYKNDDCLRNAYIGKQSNLFGDVFSAYTDDKPQSVYNSLYTKHLKEFIDYFDLFERNEKLLRSEFARRIESSNTTSTTLNKSSNPNSTQASCTNMDFETGNLSGWTQSGVGAGTAYVSTPGTDAAVPAINKVFAGGFSGCVDVLPSFGNLDWVQMSQTFLVTNANKDFVFHTAVIIDRPGHTPCSDNAKFSVNVKDASNNVIPCSGISLVGANASGAACSVFTGFQTSGFYDYLNWTPIIVPLGAYVGQNVTISFRVTRCNGGGGHGARAYVEASCNPVDLTVSGNLICPGKSVKLLAPNASGYNFSWTGPSGFSSSSYSVNPTISGVYSVTMSLISNPSCKMVMDTILVSVPSPTANFNYTVTPCAPTNSVPVISTSTPASGDPISSYSWIWGDATANGSGSSTNHTYAATGTKTVELKIQSTAGCRDSITKSFAISPQITANFNVTNACLNIATNFTSSSTPTLGIASHAWNFGDGSAIGSGANPSHTYTNSGTFTITYTVTNTDLCQSTITKTVTIYPNPVIAISANTVCLGSATIFNNTSSVAAPDNIATWAWDFDNNGTPDNGAQNPTNTFTTSGTFNVELKAITNNSCRDSLTIPVKVNALPTATFTPVNACVNTNVVLNNTSSVSAPDNISLYNWNFGAGASPATSAVANPSPLLYASSGVKTIVLNITANTTCTASITQTITVFPGPVANFSTTSVCQSTATAFTDLSTPTGSISSWQWDFTNNGSVDNATASPANIYASSGTFTTSLIVTSSNGCTDTVALPIDVWGHAIPDFSPNNVCFGTATTFTNNTNITTNPNLGTTPSYSWNFADGTGVQVLAGNPAHTYVLGGNVNAIYNVTLTATTSHNCIDNVVKVVNVYAIPTASFTSDSVCLGSPSHMLNTSNGNGNTVNNFIWDFLSNGTVDATGVSNPSFTFPNIGNNAVTYTVSSTPAAGLTCRNVTNTISVYVFPNPVPDFTFVNKCVNAQPNTFDASSSSIAVGTNTSFTWAFGDGGTSPTNATPTHTYAAAGLYNTTLTVTSSKGCQTSIVKQVEVYKKPIMSITASNSCFHAAATFTANSLAGSGVVNYWGWDFNNVIATMEGFGQTTNYVFPTAGNQTVHLVASTINGCVETFTLPIYVDYLPTPAFTSTKPDGCPIHCVTFTDNTPTLTAPGLNNTWQWVFGDGTTITSNSSANQNHCYDNSSSSQIALFDVKLIVTTDKGCKDSLIKTSFIKVYPTPIANYTVDPNPGSILTPVEQFTNQSVDFTKWWWCFGDGPISDSTHLNPLHNYTSENADSYYSYLIVVNQYGCKDTANVKVEIKPEFTFYIPNAFTPSNEDNVNDFFTGMGIGIDKYEMWIFDRWGVSIFYTDDIHKGWNGKVQGKDATVQQDVYIWKVKLRDVLGQKHDYVGHVTLLR